MENKCSFCGSDASASTLVATLNGEPRSRVCAHCYFIAIDLGYSVVYMDAEPEPAHDIAS